MAKSLKEVLLQSGLTQEQIDALDAKVMNSLGGVLTTAEQAQADALTKQQEAATAAAKAEADRKAAEESVTAAKAAQDAAELQKRSVDEFWQNTYNPGVAAWEAERAKLAKAASDAAAEAAYYKAQRGGYLETLGIKPDDAPVFTPAASTTPAVDPNKTPGSPTFVDPNVIVSRVGDGMQTISDIQWKYSTLYGGQPLPVAPSELIKQADALKLSPMEYATRTFKFAEKEAERRQAEAKKHDDEIAAATSAAKDAEYKTQIEKMQAEFSAKEKLRAEQGGNNPDVKLPPGSSKFADLQRATKAGDRPDPLKLNPQERRKVTLDNIHKAIEERETVTA